MANSFYDDPRRVEYDKKRTLKKTLEKWYTVCFFLFAGCGTLLTLITVIPAIIGAAGGKPLGLITLPLMITGFVCGALGCHKRSNVLCLIAVLAFAAVSILWRSAYFMIYGGAAAAVFCLNRKWAELEQAEGFPDFDYAVIERQERAALEHKELTAAIPDRTVDDLTARRLPQAVPGADKKPAFKPGEMDTL